MQLNCHLFGVNLHTFYSEKQLSCNLFWCKLTHILTVKTAQLPPLWALTPYLLVSSADNLCKQFGPRSGTTKQAQLPPHLVLTLHILTVKTAQLPPLWAFTLCLLVSSADNLFKQLGPRSGLTKRRAWSASNMFDTQMVFLKQFFKNK